MKYHILLHILDITKNFGIILEEDDIKVTKTNIITAYFTSNLSWLKSKKNFNPIFEFQLKYFINSFHFSRSIDIKRHLTANGFCYFVSKNGHNSSRICFSSYNCVTNGNVGVENHLSEYINFWVEIMLWKCRAPLWIIDASALNAFTEEQYDPLKLCKSNIACPTFFTTQMQKLPSKTELQADFL